MVVTIYHPLSEHFAQVRGSDIRIIAQMPIWLSQLVEFKKSPCYTCYDPLVETLSPGNEELVWDSFHTAPVTEESEYGTLRSQGERTNVQETPNRGPLPINSFGTAVEVERWAIKQEDSYVE